MKFWKKSLLVEIVGSFLMLSLTTVSIVGYTAFGQARQYLKESVFDRLSVAATFKEEELNRWFIDQRQNLLSIAELPEISSPTKVLLTGKKSEAEYDRALKAIEKSLIPYTSSQGGLAEIFILSRGSRVLFSTNEANLGKYQPLVQYSEVTKEATDALVSNFYRSPDTGKPTITFATPLVDENGKTLGMLAVDLNLNRIDEIIRSADGLGKTGETYLVGNLGSSLSNRNVFVSADRFGSDEFPDGIESEAIVRAISATDGAGLYRNYRGVPVIGVYHWLENLDLALITEIHQEEAFVPAGDLAVRILAIGFISVASMAVAMFVLGRRITKPIQAIARTALFVSAGDLTQKAPVLTENEIGVLAHTFNQMTNKLKHSYQELEDYNRTLEEKVEARTKELTDKNEKIKQALKELKQTQSQLIQNEKMAGLGQLVAGVAHEINNPVGFIYGNVSPAKDYARDLLDLLGLYQLHYPEPAEEIQEELERLEIDFLEEDFLKLLDSMEEGANRIKKIVLSLRNFSRLDESAQKEVDISEGIDSTLLILKSRLTNKSGREIEIIKEYGKLPKIDCLPSQLNQVFMNILANAIDAIEMSPPNEDNKPFIKVTTEVINKEWIGIRIGDNGPGIPKDIRERIFDPFYTTKPVGKGTGLGLSLSYQIVVEKHGGRIDCRSEIGRGTEFIIELPVSFNNS